MSKEKNLTSRTEFLSPLTYLVFGVSFVTLFFNTKSQDPFNTPKLVALLIIASLTINYLLKFWQVNSVQKNKVDLIFISLLSFFLLSGIVAVVFSDSKLIALIGETQRRNGFLAYLALSLVALTASRLITFNSSKNLFRISILTGVVFSFYGIIQMSGSDPVSWNNPYNSVIATVGNPNFASALMAVFSVLAFSILFVKNFSTTFKILAIICIAMSVTAIVSSNSRQGLVSLAFAIAFFLSIFLYSSRRFLGWIVISLSALSSVLAIVGMLQKGPLVALLYKPSVSVRGFYWDAAIEMFKNYPLTGVGFDHYGYYFKELRSVEYPLRYGFDLTSTNAHNTFLQMFSTGGLLLGLSYLVLVISTLVVGLKLVKDSDSNQRVLSLGLLSAWLAFQAQSIISIDNIGISVWGWLLTGAIFGLVSRKELQKNLIEPSKSSRMIRNQINVLPFLISTVVLIPALILSVLLMRIESNTFMARNVLENYAGQANKASAISQQLLRLLDQHSSYVLDNKIADPNYKIQTAYDLFNSGKQQESIRIANELVKSNPRNLYALDAVALLSRELKDPTTEIQARKSIEKLDPWNGKNYLQLMILYKAAGDIINAQLMLDKILSFAPDTNEAKSALEEFSK
jgi:O-antigen ligase